MLFFRKKKTALDKAALAEALTECGIRLKALREGYINEAKGQTEAFASLRLHASERLLSLIGELERIAVNISVALPPRDMKDGEKIGGGMLRAVEEIKHSARRCVLNPAAVDSKLVPAVSELQAWSKLLMQV